MSWGKFECGVSFGIVTFYHKGLAKAVKETYPLEIANCDFKFPKHGGRRDKGIVEIVALRPF